MRALHPITLLLCGLTAGCFGNRADVTELTQVLPKGYTCTIAPNALDKAGIVFYVDKDGVRYDAATVADQVKIPAPGAVAGAIYNADDEFNAAALINLVGVKSGAVNVDANAQFNARHKATYELGDRQEQRSFDDVLAPAQKIIANDAEHAGSKWYVIREIQQAKKIKMTVDNGILGAFGGEAKFKSVVDVKPSVKLTYGGMLTVEQAMGDPLTVCIKAQRIDHKPADKDARFAEVIALTTQPLDEFYVGNGKAPKAAALKPPIDAIVR